jgi:hypothetical protein
VKVWITISDEAQRAIRSCAEGEWRETGRRQPDGTWRIPLREDIAKRLDQVRQSGESYSDVVIRICAGKPN